MHTHVLCMQSTYGREDKFLMFTLNVKFNEYPLLDICHFLEERKDSMLFEVGQLNSQSYTLSNVYNKSHIE